MSADDNHHFLVRVITAPSNEDKNVQRVIAIAVWERDYLEEESNAIGGMSLPQRLDR
jgi:hypothetical protein